jgi:hypothetical protein
LYALARAAGETEEKQCLRQEVQRLRQQAQHNKTMEELRLRQEAQRKKAMEE